MFYIEYVKRVKEEEGKTIETVVEREIPSNDKRLDGNLLKFFDKNERLIDVYDWNNIRRMKFYRS